jgi:rfaE bifunctional protein nucleotidyltransferase chain/domain
MPQIQGNLSKIKSKIIDLVKLGEIRDGLRQGGKSIVFTNGCFDILHRGHVEYLAKAADLGDFLLVGLNSDASVKRQNKSPERPINDELTRGITLASLFFIDAIVVFNEDNPLELIRKVLPDVLVKGGDYDENERNSESKKYIIGSDLVRASGGKVITIPLVEGYSTTSLITKIKS